MVHFRPYKTCYDIWKKARNVYANDIQRIYESVHGLATLRTVDNDLPTYLNRAQSTIDELKLMLVSDDPQQILNKLDNMFMVFILQGLHKDYGSVRDQILTNPVIPTVEELIDRLIRVPSPEADPHTESESFAFISSTADRGSRGRGRGKGGRGNLHCTYCQRDGHTRDRCYSLHGFPSKTANVVQSPTSAPELKIEPEGNQPITLSHYLPMITKSIFNSRQLNRPLLPSLLLILVILQFVSLILLLLDLQFWTSVLLIT
uniref:Retrovirus-related Pol polyprotein from transposon TNT 1-94 n=1 Tax=Cajanus cajan TaxID=3821 RepID=A0A151SB68_CAJCA|nr:hypothetical protein KK1_025985 [Cajanus cajan]